MSVAGCVLEKFSKPAWKTVLDRSPWWWISASTAAANSLLVQSKLPKKFVSILSVEEVTDRFLWHFKFSNWSLVNTTQCSTPLLLESLSREKGKPNPLPSACLSFFFFFLLYSVSSILKCRITTYVKTETSRGHYFEGYWRVGQNVWSSVSAGGMVCWAFGVFLSTGWQLGQCWGAETLCWTLLSMRLWFGRQEEFLSSAMGCSVSRPLCPEGFLRSCNQSLSTDLA